MDKHMYLYLLGLIAYPLTMYVTSQYFHPYFHPYSILIPYLVHGRYLRIVTMATCHGWASALRDGGSLTLLTSSNQQRK